MWRTSGSSFAHSALNDLLRSHAIMNDVDIWCDSVLPDSETRSKARARGLSFEFKLFSWHISVQYLVGMIVNV